MLKISENITLPLSEVEITAVRAQGSGGQNVNKVSSAVHLRFDVAASSLPAPYKERLLRLHDQRITRQGVIVIKAQQHRSQEQNRREALERLRRMLVRATVRPARRVPTQPSRAARRRRLEAKLRRGTLKTLRGRVDKGGD